MRDRPERLARCGDEWRYGLTFTLGFGNPTVIAVIALVALAATLTISPVVYQTLEKIAFFKVGAVIVFLIVAIFAVISRVPGPTCRRRRSRASAGYPTSPRRSSWTP